VDCVACRTSEWEKGVTSKILASTHSDSVDHTQTQGSPLQTVPHGQDGVRSLTGLGHKDGDIVSEDGSLSVEEIRGYRRGGTIINQLGSTRTDLVSTGAYPARRQRESRSTPRKQVGPGHHIAILNGQLKDQQHQSPHRDLRRYTSGNWFHRRRTTTSYTS
jgi:hypothetical protein